MTQRLPEIYLDHAATTPLHPDVLAAMLPYLTTVYANPSGLHAASRVARRALDDARETVAEALGCHPAEVVFTSGGTESDNLALVGAALANADRGEGVVTTAVEHHAVLSAAAGLERRGCRVAYLPVDRHGLPNLDALDAALDEPTALVSLIHANNEVGTVSPVAEIARRVKARGPRTLVHTDAVQSTGALDVDVDRLGVDLLSLSAHKLGGPKGVGALYVRRGVRLAPLLRGGPQERGRRAGTENVAGAVGLAEALRLATENREANVSRLRALRDRVIEGVLRIPGAVLTGHPTDRLPGHASFCVAGVDSETLVLALDRRGIAVGAGAACASGALEPSHVLRAMGVPDGLARGALRVTLGIGNDAEQVGRFLSALAEVVGEASA